MLTLLGVCVIVEYNRSTVTFLGLYPSTLLMTVFGLVEVEYIAELPGLLKDVIEV